MLEQPLKILCRILRGGLTGTAHSALHRAHGGAAFLTLMGISLEALRIFGGLLLFLLAPEMVQVPGRSASAERVS